MTYQSVGRPSFRDVEARSRRAGRVISASTARNLAEGETRPHRRSVEGFLLGCGVGRADLDEFLRTWDRLNATPRDVSPAPLEVRADSGDSGRPGLVTLSPRDRDALRAERNRKLNEAMVSREGIEKSTIFQLEDHSDKGYLLHVRFDRGVTSAAKVLAMIRVVFGDLFPDIPYWGQILTEDDESVAFNFTYIDHNAEFAT
jgi:hypothetical protein